MLKRVKRAGTDVKPTTDFRAYFTSAINLIKKNRNKYFIFGRVFIFSIILVQNPNCPLSVPFPLCIRADSRFITLLMETDLKGP